MPSPASTPAPPGWNGLCGAWFVATTATLGSLFFSEIMELPPCSLCWYQRIFMFPLPLLLLVGLLPFDARAARYGLVLTAAGWAIAVWHTLLYVGILPETAAPCAQGVPCGAPTFELFGVLSIPALSLVAFTTIAALLLQSWHASRSQP